MMRCLIIVAGLALVTRFDWILYLFGAFLVITGGRMISGKAKDVHPENNPMVRWFSKLVPVTRGYVKQKFFIMRKRRRMATPLFVALLVIESTDLMFAVDSIPAVLAVSHDRMIIITSNIFAILGLRALFFAFAAILPLFHYLNRGLALILIFVGIKMLLENHLHIPITLALGVIAGILAISVGASLIFPKKPSVRKAKGTSKN